MKKKNMAKSNTYGPWSTNEARQRLKVLPREFNHHSKKRLIIYKWLTSCLYGYIKFFYPSGYIHPQSDSSVDVSNQRVFLTGLGSPFRVRVAPDATPALGNKWPYF